MEDNTPLLKQKQTEGKVQDKPKSKRSVRSEAQLQALAKGREKRFENLHKTRKDLEELKQIREQQKQQQEVQKVEPKKTHKGTGVSKKEVVVEESDDDSEATPIIIKKKKTHKGTGVSKKPKVIYVESEDDDEEEESEVEEQPQKSKKQFKELKNKKYNKKTPALEATKNVTKTSIPEKKQQPKPEIDYSKFFC
jgi:hypothetical protein